MPGTSDPGPPATHAYGADGAVDPPGPEAVARRACVLAAVTTRGFVENERNTVGAAGLPKLLAFYDQLGLAADAEPAENAVVRARYGTLSEQATIDACWRVEGLAVLAWSLGLFDLPPVDTMTEVPALGAALGLPWRRAADAGLLRSPRLRPAEDLRALDARLLTAHWRVREFQLRPVAMDFVAWLPTAWWGGMTLDGLDLADRDLAVRGVPIAEADPADVARTGSILVERRLAASWLRGYDALYSEGDTNT